MNTIILDEDIPISSFINKKNKKHLKGKICLGLCCINNGLRKFKDENGKKKEIFCSRSTVRANFSVEKVKNLAIQNIQDISKLVDWNVKHGINHLRLSSDMFPHFTDRETTPYSLDFAIPYLEEAGEYCKKVGQRITTHPAQFNQIGALSEEVFESTIKDLKMHADMLDYMGVEEEGSMCIHMGGMYGNKDKTMRRWIDQFDDLPGNVKRRLGLEHDEKCYSTRDCLVISEALSIPVIHDTLHHRCYHDHYNSSDPEEEIEDLVREVVHTWKNNKPIFHLAEQDLNKKYVGAHSSMISKIPQYLIDLVEEYDDLTLSLEVEAKAKEAAILQLMKTHKGLF
jgi:UV DNA damage endonuclease